MNKVIRISPEVGATADNGLFFDFMEIPNVTSRLGGTALLKSVTSIVKTEDNHPDLDLIFFQKDATIGGSIGTRGSVVSVAEGGNLLSSIPVGVVALPEVATGESVDLTGSSVSTALNIDLVLQAEENSQSIYVAGFVRDAVTDSNIELTLSLGFEQ